MYLVLSFATFLTLLSSASARPGLWDVHIEKGPAPSPEDGPPLSAGATRDPSKLKYEIIGIGGAAVGWILLTIILLFAVGRRLRRRAQSSARTLGVQMLRTAAPMEVQPGPLSPGKMASLRSWVSGGKHSYKQSNVSVSTVDEKLVEADRQRNMDEMSRLYAAVLAHDEEKQSQKARSSGQTSPQSPNFSHPRPNAVTRLPSPPISPQYPPEFQHLRNASHEIEAAPRHPMAPTDQLQSASTSRASTKVRASPLSLANSNLHDRTGSSFSARSRAGQSIRGLPISEPVAMADLTQSAQYPSARSPLSPRLYDPGPPPPTPGKQTMITQTVEIEPPRRTPGAASIAPSMNSSKTTLPLRQYEQLRSAPATKTTFLERQPDLGRHPKTGVPMSPYSPYTPFTPMTPITPSRLVTKEERKKQKKKDGLKVLSEDDQVMSDEDMWGM
jgi:hypothetical protein